MKYSKASALINKTSAPFKSGYLILIIVSVLALMVTFFISNSALEDETKFVMFAGSAVLYLFFGGALYFLQNRKINKQAEVPAIPETDAEKFITPGIHEKLLIFDEAKTFFADSLKPADMFRLITRRIEELIPFANCVLFLANEDKTKLKAAFAVGKSSAEFLDTNRVLNKGLAGRVFSGCRVEVDETLQSERSLYPDEALKNLNSAAAAPLLLDKGEVFAVLTLYAEGKEAFDAKSKALLGEIARRISPLFANSLNYERNLENSLRDALTNLPNERAFYLVLENQIAESQRLREQRPLSVVSIDIKGFDDSNKKYGHVTADEILKTTAKIIKGQLRQMDFLARVSGDEFLAVLPTASAEVTKIIIERIDKAFSNNPLRVTETDEIYIRLNFGTSSFIEDGETAQELLKRAVLKKREAKSGLENSVIWFPHKFVN